MTNAEINTEQLGQHPFRVGDWDVDPASGQITRGNETVGLEPRVMDVLVYLAERPGEVVAREQLEASVWKDRVVGYDALTSTMLKLRKALGDDPHEPSYIETLSKRGYRFIADVTIPRVSANVSDESTQPHQSRLQVTEESKKGIRITVAALIILMLLILAGFSWSVYREAQRLKSLDVDPAAIAVLPFDNLGRDAAQQYFADGLADDLITDLTQLSGLHVISRDSSFNYREQPVDIARAAYDLGVRYILHGSVRRDGDRMRINAYLTDATNNTQLWAERYDGDVQDILSVQDQFTGKIVNALSLRLTPDERSTLAFRDTESFGAYEFFLRGEEQFFLYARDSNALARKLFSQALAQDDRFARAYAMLAWTHVFDFMNGWSDEPDVSLDRAMQFATRALELNASLPLAYFVRGLVHRERGEHVKAMVEAEKAITLDPSYANGHILMSTLLYYAGRPEEGLERIYHAISLNPHYPYNYPFHLGQAYFVLHRYDEAIEAFKQGLASNPSAERLHIWLAAAYAQSGNIEDAEWEIEEVLMANPDFSLAKLERAFPFSDPADLDHLLQGLYKAGLEPPKPVSPSQAGM